MLIDIANPGRSGKGTEKAPSLTPVCGEPLLLVEGEHRILVAADIHLGIEHDLWLCGVSIPSQTGKALERLKREVAKARPDRLILLGDVKHNVPRTTWQEKREVPDFLKALAEDVEVLIIPGNHDVGIADLAPAGTMVLSATGAVIDGVGYFHGHTWPDKDVLKVGALVCAHLHPAVRLRDPIGYAQSERVWARSGISIDALKSQYDDDAGICAEEIIIMPAANELRGGLPLNELSEGDYRGPVLALAEMELARIYLLDGTDLGRLRDFKEDLNPRGRRGKG